MRSAATTSHASSAPPARPDPTGRARPPAPHEGGLATAAARGRSGSDPARWPIQSPAPNESTPARDRRPPDQRARQTVAGPLSDGQIRDEPFSREQLAGLVKREVVG